MNAAAPTVSIITPAYNAGRFIKEAIESAQAQTFSDWEMIVADDCSHDDTQEIVAELAQADPRIRLLPLETNRGPALARKAAIDSARARYIAFLDSDDIWLPEKLQSQLDFMRSEDVAFSFTQYQLIDANGDLMGKLIPVIDRVDYPLLLKNTLIGCLTVMLDRTKTGPLRTVSMSQHVDLVIWFDILKRGVVARGMAEDLARYRIVGGSVSRNKTRSAIHMWHVYRRVEKLSFLSTAWYFSNYAWNAFWKYRS